MSSDEQKYIDTRAVCKRYGGVARCTLNRWQKLDVNPFPAPAINGSGYSNRYLVADLDAWDLLQNSPTIDSSRENHAA